MVISIDSHFFQIVVLSADTNAFLRVHRPVIFPLTGANKYIFKLIHSRIGKQKRGVLLRDYRRAVEYFMSFFPEEIQKAISYLTRMHYYLLLLAR